MEPTPRLKRIMQLATDEARRANATSVGTEHVLLAILRDNRGSAASVLQQAGLNVDKARGLLVGITGKPDIDVPEGAPPAVAPPPAGPGDRRPG